MADDLRERVEREVIQALAQMARWAQHQDTEPDSEAVTDRILALLSHPEPPTEFARGVLAALTWYRNLPTEEERQQAADMLADDPELQDIIARLNARISAPEPAKTGADMPVRAMVEEVDHLREALYMIAFYDPDEVRRSGVTPTDMRDIARNALARSLATREEMEEADTDG